MSEDHSLNSLRETPQVRLADAARWATLALVAACLALPGAAAAGVISADWKTAGDGLLTHDTATGNDWLDLTQSTNLSYNYVESQLVPGGLFAGFHHASYAELVTFQTDAGIPDIGFPSTANLVPVQNLISLVGVTDTVLSTLDSDGFYNGTQFSSTGSHDRFHIFAPFQGNEGATNFYGDSFPFDDNYHDPRVGHWLVRAQAAPAATPEPATLTLMACGMLMLPMIARRTKRHAANSQTRCPNTLP